MRVGLGQNKTSQLSVRSLIGVMRLLIYKRSDCYDRVLIKFSVLGIC